LREIAYFHEQGLVSSLEDYLNLPASVLDDARMVGEGEAVRQKRMEARNGR